MDKSDVVLLLAFAGTYDYRKTGDADVEAWYLAVGDLDLDDAKRAVVAHYRSTDARMMPFHVRQGVKAIRDERRRHEPHPIRALPSPFEDDMGRQVQIAAGAATIRQVLGPVLEHIAERSAGQAGAVSALDELRAITPGPDWADPDATDGTDGGTA